MEFTLLTPTGDRPEAFELCERWVRRQSLRPVKWVVIDDGLTPTKCRAGQVHIYAPELRGTASLVNKLKAFVDDNMLVGDAVAIIEDDDWYRPSYLETQAARLREGYEVAGEGCALYYNVAGRWWYSHTNVHHASLCQTVIKRSWLPALRSECGQENPFIDVRFWARTKDAGRVFMPGKNGPTTVGIKSMPGRVGYGMGHRTRHHQAVADLGLIKLKQLIGSDVDAYEPFYQS